MKKIELPCAIEVIFNTEYVNFTLSNYNKTWFTDRNKWLKECEILRESYRREKKVNR